MRDLQRMLTVWFVSLTAATAGVAAPPAESLAALTADQPGAVTRTDARTGRVSQVTRLSVATEGTDAEARARSFLAARGQAFGIDAATATDPTTVSFSGTSELAGTTIVRFVEKQSGLPVDGSSIQIALDASGRVQRVTSTWVSAKTALPATISDADAVQIALLRAGVSIANDPSYRAVVVERLDGQAVRAVKVVIAHPETFEARAFLVDTAKGELIGSQPTTVR